MTRKLLRSGLKRGPSRGSRATRLDDSSPFDDRADQKFAAAVICSQTHGLCLSVVTGQRAWFGNSPRGVSLNSGAVERKFRVNLPGVDSAAYNYAIGGGRDKVSEKGPTTS